MSNTETASATEEHSNGEPSTEAVAEVLTEAEETVVEAAESVTEDLQESHETIHEGEREVEDAVHEESQEAAQELGHPELADQIAEGLFRRLDERGLLPHTQHHSIVPVAEGEHIVETVADVPPEIAEETVTAAEEVAPDVPPEPGHWYYRSLRFRKR